MRNCNEMQDMCYRFWNRHIRLFSYVTFSLRYVTVTLLTCTAYRRYSFGVANQMDSASMSMRTPRVSHCLVKSCAQLGEYPGWKSYKRAIHQLNPNNAERRG